MCEISSPSKKEKNIAKFVTQQLTELGAQIFTDDTGSKINGEQGNIIAYIPGNIKKEPILFAAHLDTVTPADNVQTLIKEDRIVSKGDTVLGADDKSGIAQILEAVRTLKENDVPHGDIEIVLTAAEEIGLLGSKNLDYSKIKSKNGFALDAADINQITVKAPCQYSITWKIKGKAAHAGMEPEKGINAIKTAADAISKMKLGKIDFETTANIGVIQGGKATNIVTEEVLVKGELRSHNLQKLEYYKNQMLQCFWEAGSQPYLIDGETLFPKIEEKVVKEYHAIQLTDDDLAVQLAEKAISKIGLKPEKAAIGGGSDANIFNGNGIKTAVLGTGMQKYHTTDEYILIDDLVKGAEMVLEIIRIYAEMK